MKIYLAGAFFNHEERTTISYLANILREQGHSVFVPMEQKVENEWKISNKEWGKQVFISDVNAIKKADCVVAVIQDGMNNDTGTVWEIGFAYGIKKTTYVIHLEKCVSSLMIWNGCTVNFDFYSILKDRWPNIKVDTINIEQK